MGRLVVQQFVSADGFAADADGGFTLFDSMDASSEDFDVSNAQWIDAAGAIVLGGNTYRMFREYWPTHASDGELVAPKINTLPIFVFSRTLAEAPWGDYAPATIESDAVGIHRIKDEIEGDVILWGSLELTESFFATGEVDVVRLVILPVAIGAGIRVMPANSGVTKLQLLDTRTFSSGLVEHEYAIQH